MANNLNIMIQLTSKRKVFIFNYRNKNRKKLSILKDECESLSNIVAQFKQQNVDVKILFYCSVTGKPWIICFKLEKIVSCKVAVQS